MKQTKKTLYLSRGLVCLIVLLIIHPTKCSIPMREPIMKGANMPANQLLPTYIYPGQYRAFPEPDYAWKLLKDLGVNVIQVVGGTEGNVLHIQMNENHPYGRPYDADWAQNLDRLLAKADSYGMRIVFHAMGSTYGTLMGIVAPMNAYRRQDPYTSIEESLSLIEKLGGHNELGKNFISDPRIAYWCPINEARLDHIDIRDWTIAVLRRIRQYGGKTSVCVNDGEHRYVDSFPHIIPIIGEYVDFLQAHSYQQDIVQSVGSRGSAANMYVPVYEAFSRDCESMVNGRDIFSVDQLMLTEFGCGNGAWIGMDWNITTAEHQQADYIRAVFDACEKYGITRVFYHEPINIRSHVRTLGFVNYDGAAAQEPYERYKFALLKPACMLETATKTEMTEASATIYIRPDGSIDPSTMSIRRDGNLYTLTDNILCDSIVIMTSNIVIDGKGYTIQGPGLHGSGFSLPTVTNVTIKNTNIKGFRNGFYLETTLNNIISGNELTNNTYGIYLEYASNNVISRNKIIDNEYGIEMVYSVDSTIRENDIANNKYGIRLWISNTTTISRNSITANSKCGIELDASNNNTISENNARNNWDGVYLSTSSNNTAFGNDVNNNFRGIFLYGSSNNTFHNNSFMHNTQQVYDHSWDWHYPAPSVNSWNNSYPSGGNYWSNYDGVDLYSGLYQNETESDGIGDTPHIIDAGNEDHYPLMRPLDTSPPIIYVISPENKTYPARDIPLTFTVSEPTSWIGYSLNYQVSSTISGNTTIDDLSEGTHSLTIYVNDTAENTGHSNTVHFTIDTQAPSIEILSPENKTYTTSSVSLEFTLNEPASWIGFSIDGHTNETIDATSIIMPESSDGAHYIIVYANDKAGNTGASEIIHFTINTQQTEPLQEEHLSIWIIAVIGIIALVVAGSLIHWAKVKKATDKTK